MWGCLDCQECPVALAGLPLKASISHCWPRSSLVSVHEGSPLGELHRCIREGVKVNVHIRTFKGLRGVCTGFLVAFDKFWNMVSAFLTAPMCLTDMGSLVKQSPRKTFSELKSFYTWQSPLKTALLLLSLKAGVSACVGLLFPPSQDHGAVCGELIIFLIVTSVWDAGMLPYKHWQHTNSLPSPNNQFPCPACL